MHHATSQFHIVSRIAALVLVLLLLLAAFPLSAFAAESGSCGDGLTWSLSGGALTISGSGSMTGFTDDNMAPWYSRAAEITSVTVGEGVTSIGTLAFYSCENLSHASLPSTLTAIGDRSFKNCTSLKYVNFPSGLQRIGDSAFEACESLSGIALNSGLQRIGDYAFYRCSSLTSITVPASVIDLGLVVFAYCNSLTRADIRCSITKVPDWTFYGCTALNTVSLPASVTSSGELAFYDCSNLAGISYSGTGETELTESIRTDGGAGSGVFVGTSETGSAQSSTSDEEADSYKSTSTTTEVTTGENTVITTVREVTNTYTVDGADATVIDVWNAAADETGAQQVTVNATTTTTISATVDSSEAWAEVAQQVSNAVKQNNTSTSGSGSVVTTVNSPDSIVKVNVQLTDSTVAGSDLATMAGKDVSLNITTSDGDQWVIDQSIQTKSSFSSDVYDLDYTVTEQTKKISGIDSDTVYQVTFAGSTDFSATVGVTIGSANQYATLYKKSGGKVSELQTVVVDDSGTAWFSVDGIEKKGKYYIGINAEGVDTSNAVIPASLAANYGGDDDATLVDADGTQYVVSGRSSSWGISGKRFAIYVGIAIFAIVLLVTLIMVTMNKINKSKSKYAIGEDDFSDDDDEPIDEDELRLQVMQELLEETQKKKGK